MKSLREFSQAELAALVQSHLRKSGIEVILSGGAAVGIYSNGIYVSKDIDFVNVKFTDQSEIEKTMREIGFIPVGRHFQHPDSDHIVEFPPGPLLLGDAPAKEISEISFGTGVLRVISPTDCVKDRLAHYYHWGDRQCLAQAALVAKNHAVEISEIRAWSKSEGKLSEFKEIQSDLEPV